MTLDFNHGANLPVTDIRAADISDRVNAHVDAAFYAKRAAEPTREYIGASAIGNECLRAVQFGYMQVAPDPGRITGKTLRIWETGHVFEDAIASWLKLAGFDLEVVDPETKKQFGFNVLDDEGQGHFDGIVRSGPLPLAYPFLWECKALNLKGWTDVKKHGVAVAKPLYMGQVAIGQAYLELHENPAIFTALNKNTSELYHELVPFDQRLAQDMSDRMVRVVEATQSKLLLPRAFSSPDFFKCKFCDFNRTCWDRCK
jgi:hypothetical protein